MAFSKPLLGIQSPIQCQLCEQCAKIDWKCLECDLLMCSACKNNVHSKIKTAKEHRIIDIKEIGLRVDKNAFKENEVSVELHVVEVYQTILNHVSHLAVSLDDFLWIGEGELKRKIKLFSSHTGLQKVKPVKNKLQVKSSYNILAHSLSMTPKNDLLIVTEDTRLKQIKNQGSKITNTIFDVQPYKPLVIHVTRKYKLIVGVWDKRSDTCRVLVLNNEGDQEAVYGDDPTKEVSFTQIVKITDTSNGNIFVIDTINFEEFYGSVKVLGLDNITNTYSGHSFINTDDTPFTPSSLATTAADNVIIADISSSALHILNASGELITYICIKDRGIQFPYSICLAMAGQFCILYIADLVSSDSKDKCKLHKLSITGI